MFVFINNTLYGCACWLLLGSRYTVSILTMLIFPYDQFKLSSKKACEHSFVQVLKWPKTTLSKPVFLVVFLSPALIHFNRGQRNNVFLLRDYSGGESGLGRCNHLWQSLIICSTAKARTETITRWPLSQPFFFFLHQLMKQEAQTLASERVKLVYVQRIGYKQNERGGFFNASTKCLQ